MLSNCFERTVPIQQQLDGVNTVDFCRTWAENCFGPELMTPNLNAFIDNSLSKLTIAGLQDIGYTVNLDASDEFGPELMDQACICQPETGLALASFSLQPESTASAEAQARAVAFGKHRLAEYSGVRPEALAESTNAGYTAGRVIAILYSDGGVARSILVTA
jgi:hypothetical protein